MSCDHLSPNVKGGNIAQISRIHNHCKVIKPIIMQISIDAILSLLCCPVLKPHITGEPGLPGLVMLNVSDMQSPILPPILLTAPVATAVVVPTAGPAMSKV